MLPDGGLLFDGGFPFDATFPPFDAAFGPG
jgi:hypothetical protein